MITEALLDSIKAFISGYKSTEHPLYGKSDKEIAGVIKGMISRYLTESKQQLIEDDLKSIINESKWEPDGVDKNKTYTGVRFVQPKFRQLWLKFKAELKTEFGIDVGITSAYRDPYNQGRVMYVNWLKRKPQYRFGYLNGLYGRNGGKISKIFSSYYTPSTNTISPSNLTTALDEVEKFITQSAMTISWHLKNTAVDINIVKGNKYYEPIKTWVNSGKSKYAYKALDEGDHIHINLRLTPGASDAAPKGVKTKLATTYRAWANSSPELSKKYGKQSEYDLDTTGTANSWFDRSYAAGKDEFEVYINIDPWGFVDTSSKTDKKIKNLPLKKSTVRGPALDTTEPVPIEPDTQRPQTIDQLPTLRVRSSGPDVKNVQTKLIDLYGPEILPKFGADGKFQAETLNAVKKFQKDHLLQIDGIVGQATYKTLYKYFKTVDVNMNETHSIFNINNKKHIQILKEEIQRAKRLMLEYNEESTWESMTDDQKESALLAVDDDLGPDLADEYTDMPWLRIPDVITNRIDLRTYMQDKPDRQSMMFTRSLMRGIQNRVKEDANAAKFVKSYLGKTLAQSVEDLTSDQIKDLMDKLHSFQASLSKFSAPSEEEMEASNLRMKNVMDKDRIEYPGFSRD